MTAQPAALQAVRDGELPVEDRILGFRDYRSMVENVEKVDKAAKALLFAQYALLALHRHRGPSDMPKGEINVHGDDAPLGEALYTITDAIGSLSSFMIDVGLAGSPARDEFLISEEWLKVCEHYKRWRGDD